MAVVDVHRFAESITCHAWSPDLSMVALCPNNNEVHIYKSSQDQWERLHVLEKHDQIVSGIDWSSKSNKIVTVSHDRNSYVWSLEGGEWVPTLVILRLNRAALCVQWSPKENKFAVGSGAKTVCICYYEQENNWLTLLGFTVLRWVSKLIRKRHESSVTSVAWHPNNVRAINTTSLSRSVDALSTKNSLEVGPRIEYNILLATTSTDGKCRVFSTFIKGVDTKDPKAGSPAESKFGEVCFLWQAYLFSNIHRIMPCIDILPTLSSNTREFFWAVSLLKQQILQLDLSYSWTFGVKWSPSGNTLAYVLFISEKMVIGVGYDSNPMVFAADDTGIWCFSEAFTKFYGQSKATTANEASESSKSRGGVHDNCINAIVSLSKAGSPKVMRFSTSGLDGKIAIWDLENMEEELGHHNFLEQICRDTRLERWIITLQNHSFLVP
ncbi:hypothetical protein YC2023_050181 [Brassica napus]